MWKLLPICIYLNGSKERDRPGTENKDGLCEEWSKKDIIDRLQNGNNNPTQVTRAWTWIANEQNIFVIIIKLCWWLRPIFLRDISKHANHPHWYYLNAFRWLHALIHQLKHNDTRNNTFPPRESSHRTCNCTARRLPAAQRPSHYDSYNHTTISFTSNSVESPAMLFCFSFGKTWRRTRVVTHGAIRCLAVSTQQNTMLRLKYRYRQIWYVLISLQKHLSHTSPVSCHIVFNCVTIQIKTRTQKYFKIIPVKFD